MTRCATYLFIYLFNNPHPERETLKELFSNVDAALLGKINDASLILQRKAAFTKLSK